MVKQITKDVSSNIYDRLSRTDTYASRKLKEKVQRTNEGGRPLFKKELDKEALNAYNTRTNTIPTIKHSNSGTTASTSSRSSLSNTSTTRSTSVFDRLATTGTKSSLRKHKQSATYANDGETWAETTEKIFSKGYRVIKPVRTGRSRKEMPFQNQNEAEV